MSTVELRRQIKKKVDRLPPQRPVSLADYVDFLTRPSVEKRVSEAQKAIKAGRGTSWRNVRSRCLRWFSPRGAGLFRGGRRSAGTQARPLLRTTGN